MAGLGLIGNVAAGAAGGYFEGALKQIEEKRKEGFASLQAGLNQETNTLNNTQRNNYSIEQEKVRQANNLATTEMQADRADSRAVLSDANSLARSNSNNSAAMAKMEAEYKLRMKEKEFDRDNRVTETKVDPREKMVLEGHAKINVARINQGLPEISLDQYKTSLQDPSVLADAHLAHLETLQGDEAKNSYIAAIAPTLSPTAMAMLRSKLVSSETESGGGLMSTPKQTSSQGEAASAPKPSGGRTWLDLLGEARKAAKSPYGISGK